MALKVTSYIQIGDKEPVLFDSLSEEKRKEYGNRLNKIALEAIGYVEVSKSNKIKI